jgi:hypothetical protein
LTSGMRPVVKITAESLSQHDEKHVVPTPLSVGKSRKKKKGTKIRVERLVPFTITFNSTNMNHILL